MPQQRDLLLRCESRWQHQVRCLFHSFCAFWPPNRKFILINFSCVALQHAYAPTGGSSCLRSPQQCVTRVLSLGLMEPSILDATTSACLDHCLHFLTHIYSFFYALNADGSLRWKYLTGAEVLSDPIVASDGSVYVGSQDQKLYAFNRPCLAGKQIVLIH